MQNPRTAKKRDRRKSILQNETLFMQFIRLNTKLIKWSMLDHRTQKSMTSLGNDYIYKSIASPMNESNWRIIIRAHSFFRVRGIGLPRNFGLTAEFWVHRGIWRFSFEQLFFHRKWPQSNSFTCLFMMIFCLMVMVEWWNWWLMWMNNEGFISS